ncbi:MAG: NAD-dependent epimerase/dehydratase family protein [Candidatus Obscuribacterales bacterium]|nr:NAD-dependent epimerase/dehydratase family protein [Candidatus Obscuribacterales bacterium]
MNQENQVNQASQPGQKPLVAVTGAGGLVGSFLVKYLADEGFPVKGIIRTANQPQHLFDFQKNYSGSGKVSIEIADVNDASSLNRVLTDVDVLVHAAGNVNPFGKREEIFATNVSGTKTALKAACDAGLKQFIHVSSLSVITGQGDQYNVDESAPLHLCGENYADSKVEAEKAITAFVAAQPDCQIATTIVRPGFIYGPYERTWMPRLIESIKTKKAALIDGGKKETNVVYVGNLCLAVKNAILNQTAYGQVYNITDSETVTKKDLFDAIADGLKLPRVSKIIPGFIAQSFCELISTIAPKLSQSTQMKLARYSRAAYRLAGLNQGFNIDKAKRELNYINCKPFAQAMAETLTNFGGDAQTQSGSATSTKEFSGAIST